MGSITMKKFHKNGFNHQKIWVQSPKNMGSIKCPQLLDEFLTKSHTDLTAGGQLLLHGFSLAHESTSESLGDGALRCDVGFAGLSYIIIL